MTKDPGTKQVSLPIIEAASKPKLARSRMSRRRFAVLIVVQLLIIAHIVQWLVTGTTISPIEPSESMETVKYGIITAGFIFFVLMLASTMIFGRFFCGWGCHVLLLQDASTKLLNRFGLRPKPFRSRLLMLIPLILALYMFVWPLVYRFAIAPLLGYDLTWPGFSTHLITNDFWGTFPGLLVAIPFLFLCGFLIIYFLGMKGYCTYGCPYGGFFAPLDEIATGRIRVTDACEHCGHCTAVCTSNVRVHEEVRDYKMVVDPGCMKCMDCVSVCPNDALYYGFGKPAIKVDKSTGTKRKWDLSWTEEIVFAVVALLVFLSVRGVYGVISLLFASGITAIVVFLIWKGWRCLRDPNVRLHAWQLKRANSIRPIGAFFLAGIVVMVLLVAQTGAANWSVTIAEHYDNKVTIPANVVFSRDRIIPAQKMLDDARTAREFYQLSSYLGDGGIGLAWTMQPAIDNRIGWLLSVAGRLDDAEEHMRQSSERYGLSPENAAGVGRILRARGLDDESRAWYRSSIEQLPDSFSLLEEHVINLEVDEQPWAAITFLRERLATTPPEITTWLNANPDNESATAEARRIIERSPWILGAVRRLSILLMQHAETDADLQEGVDLVHRTLAIEPDNPFAYNALALGYAKQGRMDDAVLALRSSIRLEPDEPLLYQQLADLLTELGRMDEARSVRLDAQKRAELNRLRGAPPR